MKTDYTPLAHTASTAADLKPGTFFRDGDGDLCLRVDGDHIVCFWTRREDYTPAPMAASDAQVTEVVPAGTAVTLYAM
ncbi:hypothetical protein [Nitrospirillum iridis]|uniref:Uncharacterized protein n=1 Tax=Nitrospirillum iridis TaxID=765888 RepID=A0A7X0AZT0_9PROT|nr:hypothetical protein [Nitrospirillum iridis]MBB6253040.1 hypothetical protein [Nitrospirillum iridis]